MAGTYIYELSPASVCNRVMRRLWLDSTACERAILLGYTSLQLISVADLDRALDVLQPCPMPASRIRGMTPISASHPPRNSTKVVGTTAWEVALLRRCDHSFGGRPSDVDAL